MTLDLLEVGLAGRASRVLARPGENREQNCRQNRDDGDDDQKLHQGEAAAPTRSRAGRVQRVGRDELHNRAALNQAYSPCKHHSRQSCFIHNKNDTDDHPKSERPSLLSPALHVEVKLKLIGMRAQTQSGHVAAFEADDLNFLWLKPTSSGLELLSNRRSTICQLC